MSLHELSAEQREIRDLARRFADEQIAPNAAAWDRGHVFPRELFAELGELGLMGVCVPEEHGGAGADFLSYVLVLEELSRADAGVGVTVAVHTSACTLPLLAHGSPYVPALAAGEEIGAFALTEAGSGSDASAMRTKAVDSRITGTKQWITNGSYASTFIVFAREDGRASAFVVRAGAEGFAVTREEEKMGLQLLLDGRPGVRGDAGRAARRAGRRHADRARHARRRPHRDRRAGGRHRAGRARRRDRVTPRSATRSAARSRGCRRSSTSSPTCRPRSRRRAR